MGSHRAERVTYRSSLAFVHWPDDPFPTNIFASVWGSVYGTKVDCLCAGVIVHVVCNLTASRAPLPLAGSTYIVSDARDLPFLSRREDHGREIIAIRKQMSDKRASFARDLDEANSAAAALRDANLSLEGAIAGLEEGEASLRGNLQAEREDKVKIVDEVGSILY